MQTCDSLKRGFPDRPLPISKPYFITDTDIFGMLEPGNIHGPLYTSYYQAFAALFRTTDLYTTKRLGWLTRSDNISYAGDRGGPVLYRPPGQFPKGTPPSRNMMLLHGLTARGEAVLKQAGRNHPIKHAGWFKHQVANSCITASLHLSALEADIPFIPPDRITDDMGVVVPYTANGKDYDNHRLVPDYLLGVDRFYAVETDLGTEVGKADPDKFHIRKTYERMVLQYIQLIGGKLYHDAYRVPATKPLLVLFVSTEKSKLALLENIIMETTKAAREPGCNFILMKHIPAEAFSAYHSPKPLDTLWTDPWKRAGRPDFYINNPARQ